MKTALKHRRASRVTRPVITATLSPTEIDDGESATLTWSVVNASSVTLDGGIYTDDPIAINGSVTVDPSSTTDYVFDAVGPGGTHSVTRHLTVTGAGDPELPVPFGSITTEHDEVPDFAGAPTKVSAGTGNWGTSGTWTPSGVPGLNDIVEVATGHTVTYNVDSTTHISAIGVAGKLAFATGQDTQLWTSALQVYDGGELEIGTAGTPVGSSFTAEIVITSIAINLAEDPEQFCNGVLIMPGGKCRMHGAVKTPYRRLGADCSAAATSATMASAPTGWLTGDRLLLVASDQHGLDEHVSGWPAQNEFRALTSLTSSNTVANWSGGTTYAHNGWRDRDNVLDADWLPHIANMTRNIVIRSEDPDFVAGRGHFFWTGDADLDCRYVRLEAMGRTTNSTIPGEDPNNRLGRYAWHSHHVHGSASIPASGYQSVVLGCVAEETGTTPTKGGLVIHGSHYQLWQDNVVYGHAGASLVIEQGNEIENEVVGNLLVYSPGTGTRGDGDGGNPNATWREGCGMWVKSHYNYINNNICASHQMYGMLSYGGSSAFDVPDFQGADPHDDGHTQTHFPILEFDGNEIYGCTRGIAPWNIGAGFNEVNDITWPQSTVNGLKVWGGFFGTFMYPSLKFEFHGCSFRHSYSLMQNSGNFSIAILGVDYLQVQHRFYQCEFLGYKIGIGVPHKLGASSDSDIDGEQAFEVEECDFDCCVCVALHSMGAVTGGGTELTPRVTNVRNCTMSIAEFTSSSGFDPAYVTYDLSVNDGLPNKYLIQDDAIYVYDFQGDTGDDFRVWPLCTAGSFITPQTGDGHIGSPEAGQTNTANLAEHGVCMLGAIMPGTAHTRTGFIDMVEDL